MIWVELTFLFLKLTLLAKELPDQTGQAALLEMIVFLVAPAHFLHAHPAILVLLMILVLLTILAHPAILVLPSLLHHLALLLLGPAASQSNVLLAAKFKCYT